MISGRTAFSVLEDDEVPRQTSFELANEGIRIAPRTARDIMVYVGSVMGVGPEMAAILMVSRTNEFYTAWYDEEKLSYMTSDTKYKKKLPVTIGEWIR